MDVDRVATLLRVLAEARSRRALVRSVAAMALGGVFRLDQGQAVAACSGMSCQRTAECAGCGNTVCRHGVCCRAERTPCTRDNQCCSGRCLNGNCRCVKAHCPQPRPSQPCKRATCVGGLCGFTPAATTRTCRPKAGPCDVAEFCDGTSFTCPTDQFAEAGTLCQPTTCTGATTSQPSKSCDANGTCSGPNAVDCGLYRCNSVTGTCFGPGSCGGPDECADTAYCDGGICKPRLATGENCQFSNRCRSGFCTDGVCCNEACIAVCRSCVAAKTGGSDGTCGTVMDGQQDDICAGQGQVCLGGECQTS